MVKDNKLSEFEKIALIHIEELFCTALRLTKNEKAAEDLVQEAYLKAFTYFDRFEKDTNCRAWLFKILTNTFINNYRRAVKEREILSQENLPTIEENFFSRDRVNYYQNPEKGLFKRLISDDIKIALENLPLEFRMVVVLADLQEFSYKEIADVLQCPVGTVMSRLFRGRKIMRKQLLDFAFSHGIIRDKRPFIEEFKKRRVSVRKKTTRK